jgi:hypothetical protein
MTELAVTTRCVVQAKAESDLLQSVREVERNAFMDQISRRITKMKDKLDGHLEREKSSKEKKN